MTGKRHRGLLIAIVAGALFAGAAVAQTPPMPAQQASRDLPPLEELRATRERPLFAPTRRRPDAPALVAAPTPIVEDKSIPFQLTGIVAGPDIRFAILRQSGQPEEVRLRANEKVAGWTLEEIGDRYVILGGRGKRVRVWMFDESKQTGITVSDGNATVSGAAPAKRNDVDIDVVPGEQPVAQPVPRSPVRGAPPRNPAARPPPGSGPRPN